MNRGIMKFEIRNNVKSTTVHLCGWEMRMYYLIFLIFSWNWKMERKVINGSRVEIVSSVKIASKCVGCIDWKMGQVHKWDKGGLRLGYPYSRVSQGTGRPVVPLSLCPGTRTGANVPGQNPLSLNVPGQNKSKIFKKNDQIYCFRTSFSYFETSFPVIEHCFLF